jgi:hypothetical protein
MPNIDELIRDHVTLSIRCLDLNNPRDFYVAKAVPNLSHLRDLGPSQSQTPRSRTGQPPVCADQDALDRLQRPTVDAGQRT